MSLSITKSEHEQISHLWETWEKSEDLELEATFPTKTYVEWLHVVQSLRSIGLREIPAPPKLNISMGEGVRISIVGEAQIQLYKETGKLQEYHVIIKQPYGAPDITLNEYEDVKIKVRREREVEKDDERVRRALAGWATSVKTFRYMKRYSFTSKTNPGVQFDATIVQQSKPAKTLAESGLMTAHIRYEMELEALRSIAGSKGMNGFLNGIARILQGLQQSYVLISKSISVSIQSQISSVLGMTEFPGSQPATLMMEHIATEKVLGTPNIRFDDYNVTDKADGDRSLLFIAEDGRVYLMDKNMKLYGTDRKVLDANWTGVILDGEWIHQNNEKESVNYYYAFDIYNGRKGHDVTKLPFFSRVKDAATRLQEMQEAIAVLRTAEFIVKGIPPSKSLQISMKTFQPTVDPSVPGGIFREAASVLERLSIKPPYHIDGLIFTPNASPLPKGRGSWAAQLKWKPAEENTVDFLVMMEPEDSMKLNGDAFMLCKTLHLYVGSDANIQFRDVRKTVLEEEPIAPPTERVQYKPMEFISDPYDPYASICYIPIEEGKIYTNPSRDVIPDRSIVEMAYNPEQPIGFRWKPTRVRWDKTSQFQRGEFKRTFNNDRTAQSIWTSIHEPITKEMICSGSLFPKSEMLDMAKLYYKVGISKFDTKLTIGLQKFHNQYIKNKILLHSTLRSIKEPKLLDMSCGKGGDLQKWIYNGAHFVLGCDIAESGLIDPRDSIYKRYIEQIQERGGRDRVAPMVFLQADASKLYADGTAGMTPADRAMLRSLWGHPEPTVPSMVRKLEGIASSGFHIVSFMFSLHYMFRDRAMFDGWLMNLGACLQTDGYFIGCCFDGDTVAKKLQSVPEGQLLSGIQRDTTLWSIRKQYDDAYTGYLPDTEEGLGRAIRVYFASIGDEYEEYLMSFPYLVKRLSEIGCELLTDEECRSIGLRNSTAMFETSHKMAADHGELYPMIPVIQEYSYFHRWFIFKRKTSAVVAPTSTHTSPALVIRPAEDEPPAPILMREAAPAEELIELDDIVGDTHSEAPSETPTEGLISVDGELEVVEGPILKFYEKSVEKDDLKINNKGWAKYLSSAAPFEFHDRSDSSITYPNLEAAMASEKFKVASAKADLGPSLFSKLNDLSEIRKKVKDVKKYGFNQEAWNEQKESILDEYVFQRYEKDTEFQRILEAVKEQKVRLAFYTGPTAANDLGGGIDGENLYGRALMALVGTTY
jgi:SAM-dependent methyltransferase